MGLGKTLEVIALILTTFYDGQPLAIPVPGNTRLKVRTFYSILARPIHFF